MACCNMTPPEWPPLSFPTIPLPDRMFDFINPDITLAFPSVFLTWAVVWAVTTKRITYCQAVGLLLLIGGVTMLLAIFVLGALLYFIQLLIVDIEAKTREKSTSGDGNTPEENKKE